MLNQLVVVGRLVENPEIQKSEEGKNKTVITIACSRPFKNEDGIYETDFIDCVLWNSIAENTAEYCKKGDIVGIKGRIQSEMTDEGVKYEILRTKLNSLKELYDDLKPIIESKKYDSEDLELFEKVNLGIKETIEELNRLSNAKKYEINIIAEKVTFLSSGKTESED